MSNQLAEVEAFWRRRGEQYAQKNVQDWLRGPPDKFFDLDERRKAIEIMRGRVTGDYLFVMHSGEAHRTLDGICMAYAACGHTDEQIVQAVGAAQRQIEAWLVAGYMARLDFLARPEHQTLDGLSAAEFRHAAQQALSDVRQTRDPALLERLAESHGL